MQQRFARILRLPDIRVQREIDRQHAAGLLPEPASIEFLRHVHRAFYEGAPPEILVIQGRDRQVAMIPGEFRSREHLTPAEIDRLIAAAQRRSGSGVTVTTTPR